MGQVSSQAKAPGAYVSNPRRFCIREISVYPNDGDETGVGPALTPINTHQYMQIDIDPQTAQVAAKRSDARPLEFVQDPDSRALVLKVPYCSSITFRFKITMLVTPNNEISNVTFVTADSASSLDSFVDTELLQNPNIQNEDNVYLLGDFSARTDAPRIVQINFLWTWLPPHPSSRVGGYPLYFTFCEYNKRDHKLAPLAGGALWISENPEDAYVLGPPARVLSPGPQYPIPGPSAQDSVLEPFSPDSSCLMSPLKDLSFRDQANLSNLSTSKEAIADLAQRPEVGQSGQPEDGPVFRSTIGSMEKNSAQFKTHIKTLLKRAMLLHERLKEVAESQRWFGMAVAAAAKSDVRSLRPIASFYYSSDVGLTTLSNYLLVATNDLADSVIAPLRHFYESEVKTFDVRKREFDDESSQYYSWMSRYLGTKKDKRDKTLGNDAKYTEKRRAFELSRFDYYTFLLDLHGGRKLQLLVQQLALHAQRLSDATIALGNDFYLNSKPKIDTVVNDIRNAGKDWSRHRTERETHRRALERSIGENDPAVGAQAANSTVAPIAAARNQTSEALLAATRPNNNTTARPGEGDESQSGKKEGLLWALSRPGGVQETQNLQKQGLKWHKYWVVQDGGKLCEYTNWKQGMVLHNEPIDLKVASVREARSADRRFCFEVMTPSYKRVYQATSDDDTRSWIRSISKGITNSLETMTGNELHISKPRETKDKLEKLGRKLSLKTDRPRFSMQQALISPSSSGNVPVSTSFTGPLSVAANGAGSIQRRRSLGVAGHENDRKALSEPAKTSNLLTLLQQHPSNRQCADCNSTNNVEWVSINLMVVLCIDCSGAHRSLGAHISKVRSLTLDTISFTPDLVAALRAVSNQQMNEIWEARQVSKQHIDDRNRLHYISEKYVEKLFIKEIEKPNALLRWAIGEQDVMAICRALASRANPNTESDNDEPLLIYSLRCAPASSTVFPVAEILWVSGANLPTSVPDNLSLAAKTFLAQRYKR